MAKGWFSITNGLKYLAKLLIHPCKIFNFAALKHFVFGASKIKDFRMPENP